MKKKSFVIFLAAISLGLVFASSAGSQVFDTETPISQIILGFALLMLIGVSLAYFVMIRHTWPRLNQFSFKTRSLWISVCLLAGFFLVYTLPLIAYPQINYLKITATGEKDPRAEVSEVWLAKIGSGYKTASSNIYGLCGGNWEQNWDLGYVMLYSYRNQPADLTCRVKADNFLVIRFGRSTFSGKVEVTYHGLVVKEDLYSETSSTKAIIFPVPLNSQKVIIRYFLLLSDAFSIGIFLLVTSVYFVTRTSRIQKDKPGIHAPRSLRTKQIALRLRERLKTLEWYWYALPLAVVWLVYLMAFWPGMASADTTNQWEQIITGEFTNWHPAFHTWIMWLITHLWFSLAAVVLVQIFSMSAVIGWAISTINRLGASGWLSWFTVALFLVSPANGLVAISPWKDVPYSLSIVALTVLILKIVSSKGATLEKPGLWPLLGIVSCLIALFRHNGWPVMLGTLAVLILVYRHYRRRLLYALTLALASWWIVTGPAYRYLGVSSLPNDEGRNPAIELSLLSLISKHKESGTYFLTEEDSLLKEMQPFANNPSIKDWSLLTDNSIALSRTAFNLTLRSPGTTLNYLFSRMNYIFQVFQPPVGRFGYVSTQSKPKHLELTIVSKLPEVRFILTMLANLTKRPKTDWFFWRNAFWMYLSFFATIIACLRTRSWKYLLVTLPMVLNALPLIVFAGGQIYRYIIPTIWVSTLLSGYLLFIPYPTEAQSEKETGPAFQSPEIAPTT